MCAASDGVGSPFVPSPVVAVLAAQSVARILPLADRVLVKRVVAQAKTAGGILLPDSGVKKLNEAEVVAVGPGFVGRDGKRVPVDLKAGDKVLLPEYGGQTVKAPGAPDEEEDMQLFRADDILAKLEA